MNTLQFYDAYREDDILWVVPKESDFLLKVNWKTGSAEETYPLPLDEAGTRYKRIIRLGEDLLIFPFTGKNILLFSLKTYRFHNLFEKAYLQEKGIENFCTGDVLVQKDKIVVIPMELGTPLLIIEFRNEKYTLQSVGEWNGKVEKLLKEIPYRTTISVIVENRLYTPLANTPMIAVTNLDNLEMDVVRLEIEKNNIFSITEYGGRIYITTTESYDIFSWSIADGIVERYIAKKNKKTASPPYYRMIPCHGTIFIFPNSNLCNIQQLDCQKKEIKEYQDYPGQFKIISYGKGTIFYGYDFSGDTLFIYPLRGNCLLRIDVNSQTMKANSIPISWKMLKKFCENKGFCFSVDDLGYYVLGDLINSEEENKGKNTCPRRTTGELIWQSLCRGNETER